MNHTRVELQLLKRLRGFLQVKWASVVETVSRETYLELIENMLAIIGVASVISYCRAPHEKLLPIRRPDGLDILTLRQRIFEDRHCEVS